MKWLERIFDHFPPDSADSELGPDSWPAGSVPIEDIPACPLCGKMEAWQSLRGSLPTTASAGGPWRCQHCDPPR
jgi:hypothetical protein